MGKPQKTAVISLSFFAVFILFFWLWQFQAKLKSPFNPPEGYEDYLASLESGDQAVIDTDGDGLSDQDEATYGTSAYIEDSDSDGISDNEEILRGSDPNCAEGQNCFRSEDAFTDMAATSSDSSASDYEFSSEEQAALEAIISGQSDAATIRQFLLDNGASTEDLANISDEELMATYQQVVIDNADSE